MERETVVIAVDSSLTIVVGVEEWIVDTLPLSLERPVHLSQQTNLAMQRPETLSN
jgi:hypothetical protein